VAETGIKANDGAGCTDRQTRAAAFKQKLDGYLKGGAAGVLLWNWHGTKNNDCRYETIYPGDPTVSMVRDYVVPPL
jgi:hypothetical protein